MEPWAIALAVLLAMPGLWAALTLINPPPSREQERAEREFRRLMAKARADREVFNQSMNALIQRQVRRDE